MQKMISLVLFLFATTTAWAAQCPGTADIIRTKGTFYGYYWSLTDAARADWRPRPGMRFTPANYATFPETTRLVVSTDNETSDVICHYLLPDGTTIGIIANIDKAMDIQNDDPAIDQTTGIYTCKTTAAATGICHWDWATY